MILSAVPSSVLAQIPDGAAGIRATLKLMARLIRDGAKNLSVREFAASQICNYAAGNYTAEVDTLFRFVRDEIRYVGDIRDVETLHAADYTLARGYGDCDDKAILLGAMLESINHPTRLVAAGYHQPGVFEHVWVETQIGREWVACETTQPVELGWVALTPNIPERTFAYMIGNV